MAYSAHSIALLLPLLAVACGIRSGLDGGDGGVCEGFDDVPGSSGETVVEVTNTGPEAVFLSGLWSCDFALMSVVPAGADDDTHWPWRKCEPRCEDIIGQGGWGCDDSCPLAAVIKVEPGGHYPATWAGFIIEPHDLPDACCAEGECYGPCYSALPAPAGAYRATVNVFREVSCLDDPGCDCTANADGWCQLEGFAQTSPEGGTLASIEFEAPTAQVTLAL